MSGTFFTDVNVVEDENSPSLVEITLDDTNIIIEEITSYNIGISVDGGDEIQVVTEITNLEVKVLDSTTILINITEDEIQGIVADVVSNLARVRRTNLTVGSNGQTQFTIPIGANVLVSVLINQLDYMEACSYVAGSGTVTYSPSIGGYALEAGDSVVIIWQA